MRTQTRALLIAEPFFDANKQRDLLEAADKLRIRQDDKPSRAKAIRRLMHAASRSDCRARVSKPLPSVPADFRQIAAARRVPDREHIEGECARRAAVILTFSGG